MKVNEQEFTKLVQEHRATIYTVCYMFADSADEADDLFQEILIHLWKGLPSFRQESGLRTWIYRVSLNTCVSLGRKKRHYATTPLTMNINLYEDDDADSRQVQQLRQRITRLRPFDRAVVLLWLENLSYDEIGDILGITPKNVSVRLFRAKEQLKQMKDN